MDLFVAKAYNHRRNEWARYIVGHSSEDLATGATQKEAKVDAVYEVAINVDPEHKVRVEDIEAICSTPDSVLRGALT